MHLTLAISPAETALCRGSGVDFIELPIAFDGVVVVVPKQNDFVKELKVSELKKMFAPEAQGTVTSWKQVRATFPDRPLELYAPGLDSGTFDFFTSAILGESGKSRADYKSSETTKSWRVWWPSPKAGLAISGFRTT